jgi:hypothetical protein
VLAGGVALEEVAKNPSPRLVFGKQESLFLFLDRLLHDFRLPLELQQVARDHADDADVPSANKEEHDVHGSDSVVELRDPAQPQIELVLSFEAPSTDFSENNLGEVKEKVEKQRQLLDLFKTGRTEKKEELGEDATAVHPQKLSMSRESQLEREWRISPSRVLCPGPPVEACSHRLCRTSDVLLLGLMTVVV